MCAPRESPIPLEFPPKKTSAGPWVAFHTEALACWREGVATGQHWIDILGQCSADIMQPEECISAVLL